MNGIPPDTAPGPNRDSNSGLKPRYITEPDTPAIKLAPPSTNRHPPLISERVNSFPEKFSLTYTVPVFGNHDGATVPLLLFSLARVLRELSFAHSKMTLPTPAAP